VLNCIYVVIEYTETSSAQALIRNIPYIVLNFIYVVILSEYEGSL